MIKITHEVTPGAVKVNDVYHLIEHDDVHVFEIDLSSKYPDDCGIMSSENTVSVIIMAGERTLHLDTDHVNSNTWITFTGEKLNDWMVVADGSRYTVRVVFYKTSEDDDNE